MDLNNEKRLIASQLIVELFESRNIDQLKILEAQVTIAIKKLESNGERR